MVDKMLMPCCPAWVGLLVVVPSTVLGWPSMAVQRGAKNGETLQQLGAGRGGGEVNALGVLIVKVHH